MWHTSTAHDSTCNHCNGCCVCACLCLCVCDAWMDSHGDSVWFTIAITSIKRAFNLMRYECLCHFIRNTALLPSTLVLQSWELYVQAASIVANKYQAMIYIILFAVTHCCVLAHAYAYVDDLISITLIQDIAIAFSLFLFRPRTCFLLLIFLA